MTLDDQIKSVGREIGLRRAVYPKFVASKKLTQERADHELAAMEEVYKTLKQLRDGHRSPPTAWIPVSERLPDDDMSVMIACKGNEPVWIGHHDVADWYNCNGEPITSLVTHWKPIEAGPG